MVEFLKQNTQNTDILEIIGEIDASSSLKLDEHIGEMLGDGALRIVVDCSKLDYISSAGLGVFMSYVEELNKKEARMVLCGLNLKVRNVFDILGLDQLLDIVKTREEAIEKLK